MKLRKTLSIYFFLIVRLIKRNYIVKCVMNTQFRLMYLTT